MGMQLLTENGKRNKAPNCALGLTHLFHVLFAGCSMIAFVCTTQAQQPAPWVKFAPVDDFFSVSMPNLPKEESQAVSFAGLQVNGKWYSAGNPDASYALWSLVDTNHDVKRDADSYLDAAAELFWEALLKPARDNLPEHQRARASVAYVKELSAKPIAGREYTLKLGDLRGTAHVYVAEQRLLVLLAMDRPGAPWERERFLGSLSFSPDLRAVPRAARETGIGGGVSSESDVGPFRSSELEQRARVLSKLEPSYTESARKFGITGTVILRCVFSYDGQIRDLQVIRRLPHGLTEAAVRAALAIKFTPAQKNGKLVSMYMQLEYNFNLY
jgi:TonB family protein